jgi:methionine aminotransferase
MHFIHKLPDIPTTIFTVMSRRARETGALNIGQGFPDYPIDPDLAELVTAAMRDGHNQYAPMEGVPELRAAISAKLQRTQGRAPDPTSEITITCGGTEALHSAIQSLVRATDEVIVFDPAYDAYEPSVGLTGALCIRIRCDAPHFRPNWERVRAAISPHTRLIVINNPHNPACVVWDRSDLDQLAATIRDRPILVLADEVYEHVVFDGAQHQSVVAHPELAPRSLAVFSFGKTLHVTGWRVGYCVAPPTLTHEFRKVHQFNTFSIAAPLQHAIARYLVSKPDAWQGLGEFFQRKRDLLRRGLAGSGFELPPAQGTYFQLVDYHALSSLDDVAFAERMLTEARVAPIPLSPFYASVGGVRPHLPYVRICIAKRDETLQLAIERLREFAQKLKHERALVSRTA